MRKVVPFGAIVAALIFAAAAYAVTNTYTVTATVSPAKAGTKKKPVPIGLNFNYSVGEASGLRPSVIVKYAIGFGGIVANGGPFPACTAASINNVGNDSKCPRGSVVGTGNVENVAGPTNDPTQKSLKCHLDLKIYNSGAGKAALFLSGDPSAPKPCVIHVSQAIDAHYEGGPDGGTSLVFTVPPTLAHPLPGFDNSVVQVESTINKITKKVGKGRKAKTVGYYQARGGCKSGSRTVSVVFTAESGQSVTTGTKVHCAK